MPRCGEQVKRSVRHLLACVILASSVPGVATAQTAAIVARSGTGLGQISGKIVELGTARALASGSITVRRGSDTAFVGGALPKVDGSVQVVGLLPDATPFASGYLALPRLCARM